MNNVQRRLFQAFLRSGGDLTDDEELERFVRYVEALLSLLPPKLKSAIDVTWRQNEPSAYLPAVRILSQQEGADISLQTLRQRVSRGLRQLEEQVRQRQWAHGPSASPPRSR